MVILSHAGLMSCDVQVYTDTAALDGISLESPCHPVREFQITGLVRHPPFLLLFVSMA